MTVGGEASSDCPGSMTSSTSTGEGARSWFVKGLGRTSRSSWLRGGMNEILPNLFLGSLSDSTDEEQLKKNDIRHIVSIHDMARRVHPSHDSLSVLRFRLSDSPSERISDFFPEAILFIHSARIKGESVLVHCLAGVSRSATIVAAYLIAVCDLSFYNAISHMTKRRGAANPNFGFRMQLCKFADQGAKEARRVLREQVGAEAFDAQWRLDRSVTRHKIVTQLGSPGYRLPSPSSLPTTFSSLSRPRSQSRDGPFRRNQVVTSSTTDERRRTTEITRDFAFIDL